MSDPNTLCRDGTNLVCTQRVPVIFVPGVMGSRLHLSVDWLPDWYWDPELTTIMAQWLALSAAQKRALLSMDRPCVLEGDSDHCENDSQRARGWNSVAWSSYGEFLTFLEPVRFGSTQAPLYAYGYDWRQDIRRLGKQMAADILGQAVGGPGPGGSIDPSGRFGSTGILGRERAEKCIILTHSMGGLVTRAALKISSALQQKVAGVLHVVQPATGAPVLFRRFITGMVDEHDGGWGFSRILGGSADKFATVVSGCSGPNQLMPSNLYRDACRAAATGWCKYTRFREYHRTVHIPPGAVHDIFRRSSAENPPGALRTDVDSDVRDALRDRINDVEAFHNFLQDWKLEDKTWAIYGDGMMTDSTVHLDLPPEGPAPDDIRTEIIPNPEGPPATLFYGVQPDGTTVYLRQTEDLSWRGWNPSQTRHSTAPSSPTQPSRAGDGTVPAFSGSALFPGQGVELGSLPLNLAENRQYRAVGVEHEPAFRDTNVKQFVVDFIRHVMPAP